MIEIGCLANFNYPYKTEIEFAKANNLKLVQIWYDKNGISLRKDKNPLESITNSDFPAIIHAELYINEFKEHVPKLFNILKDLNHGQIIIHPVCRSGEPTAITIQTLSQNIKYAYDVFSSIGIDLFIENNSQLVPILNTAQEIYYVFNENPFVKFILDVAHMENYGSLKNIVNAKFPDMLHVADKHFNIIHEHLPLGDGELDFKYIFNEILTDFKGKIILEIVQSKDDLLKSKKILEKIIQNKIKK